eukprot:COSAG06_NODE_2275_length_7194_cov_10.705144_4_plen_92_part_00
MEDDSDGEDTPGSTPRAADAEKAGGGGGDDDDEDSDSEVGKTASFFEFSLCLSRACLGKMIVFIYKWLKNAVFRRAISPRMMRAAVRTSTR